MPEKMHERELLKMVNDPEVETEALRGYFYVDHKTSKPFHPNLQPVETVERDRGSVIDWGIELFNAASRRRRARRYNRKIRDGFSGKRLVSEGDSWFQFPILLDDVVDNLDDDYAIYSLGGAADLIEDIITQREIAPAVRDIKPAALLISGGGNDILGEGMLSAVLNGFDPTLSPREYPNETFAQTLDRIIDLYEELFRTLHDEFPDLQILCHSYDYAIPVQGGSSLGDPMADLGIDDWVLQRAIIRVIIDQFSVRLQALDNEMPWVHHTDVRQTVDDDQWFDELHPNNAGFRTVSGVFMRKIEEVTS